MDVGEEVRTKSVCEDTVAFWPVEGGVEGDAEGLCKEVSSVVDEER